MRQKTFDSGRTPRMFWLYTLALCAVYAHGAYAQSDAPTLEWAVTYQPSVGGSNRLSQMIVDAAGNVYATGIRGTVKLDSNGVVRWARPASGSSGNSDLTVDATGHVYLVESTSLSPQGAQKNSVFKLDPNGNVIWTVDPLAPNVGVATTGLSIKTDAVGNIYVSGAYLVDNYSRLEVMTFKYDAAGTELWRAREPLAYGGLPRVRMAIDAQGNVLLSGGNEYSITVTLKYDTHGRLMWQIPAGGDELLVDDDGNVYVDNAGPGGKKYDPQGNLLWSHIGGALNLGPQGRLYAATSFWGGEGNHNYGIDQYDFNGSRLWRGEYDAGADEQVFDLVVDGLGNAYVTGIREYFVNGWREEPLTVKFSASGALLWAVSQPTGSSFTLDWKIGLDGRGNVYVGGSANGGYLFYKYRQPNVSFDTSDLATIVSASVFPTSGDAFWVWHWIGVSNWGPDAARNVVMAEDINFSGSLIMHGSYVSTPPDWNCAVTSSRLTCNRLSPMPAGQTDWIGQWMYYAPWPGSPPQLSGSATTSTTSHDPYVINNTSSAALPAP